MNHETYERIPAYSPQPSSAHVSGHMSEFASRSGNSSFRAGPMTYFNLILLILLYPAMQLIGGGESTSTMLKNLNEGVLAVLLITTIIFLWGIFFFNYLGTYLETTGLVGVGLKKIRLVDFAWGGAFFVGAYTLLAGLSWVMAQIGLPMPGEISLLIPTTGSGKIIWVAVSFTAGFCEEIAFRGYLMTRLRLVGKFKSWVIPVIVSSVSFGICHAYQGWPGFILITIYGALFALLYIRTGSLWPCIIAHSINDLGALFIPQ